MNREDNLELSHEETAFRGAYLLVGWLGYFLTVVPHIVLVQLNPAPKTIGGMVFSLIQILTYPVMYLLPALFLYLGAGLARRQRRCFQWLLGGAVFLWWLTELVLWGDIIIFLRFGFHINGMVFNLLLTPGGFASMGLDAATLAPAVLVLLLSGVASFLAVYFVFARTQICLPHYFLRFSLCYLLFLVLLFVGGLLTTGVANFTHAESVLARLNAFPIAPEMSMRKFLLRLGFQEPERSVRLVLKKAGKQMYPAATIHRTTGAPRPNVIWLVGESLRADALCPEVMPNLFAFAEKSSRFLNHYSGGHGTRPGLFSMFYGLHGFSWDAFLDKRRPPLLLDWMREDDYQFLCQTSSDFSYPEFNKTIFSSVPKECIRERTKGLKPWENDAENITRLLDFIRNREPNRPFFGFCFFEATHAPYHFSPDGVLYSDYQKSINYTTISSKEADALRHRYANAAHYLDSQFQRLFAFLEADETLRENTIVIVTGDHGEEFFEKGRLGHNSTFVKEQIHVPLVLHIPGEAPRVIDVVTSHEDLPPTLAPRLGVSNPPKDFTLGQNLLSPDYKRECTVICGWDTAAVISGKFKAPLPLGIHSVWTENRVTHLDDSPCTKEEEEKFLAGFPSLMLQIQQEANKFQP